MIVNSLIDLFLGIVRLAFNGLEIVGLPFQYISTLSTITAYGIWIVGLDVMAIIVTTIVGWWTIKMTVGLVLWIWELLPLT